MVSVQIGVFLLPDKIMQRLQRRWDRADQRCMATHDTGGLSSVTSASEQVSEYIDNP